MLQGDPEPFGIGKSTMTNSFTTSTNTAGNTVTTTSRTVATTGINFRAATARTATLPGSVRTAPQVRTLPGTPDQTPGRGRLPRWVAPVGIAAALCAVGIVAATQRTDSNPAPAIVRVGAPADEIADLGPNVDLPRDLALQVTNAPRINFGPNVDLPRDLVLEAANAPRINLGPNVDLPRDLVRDQQINGNRVVAVGPTANQGPNVDLQRDLVAQTATTTSATVWTGASACVAPAQRGPNGDLAPDPTQIAASIANPGPNADLPMDLTGMRSSGADPICAAR